MGRRFEVAFLRSHDSAPLLLALCCNGCSGNRKHQRGVLLLLLFVCLLKGLVWGCSVAEGVPFPKLCRIRSSPAPPPPDFPSALNAGSAAFPFVRTNCKSWLGEELIKARQSLIERGSIKARLEIEDPPLPPQKRRATLFPADRCDSVNAAAGGRAAEGGHTKPGGDGSFCMS